MTVFPQMMMPGGATGSSPLYLVDSSTAPSGATITLPDDIIAGDLIVLLDVGNAFSGGVTSVVPAGFTAQLNTTNGNTYRVIFSTKEAAGTEGGTTITGMNELYEGKLALVFRNSSGTPSGLTVGGLATRAMTASDPASITTSAAGSAPLIVLGLWFGASGLTSQTTDLTMDGSAVGTVDSRSSILRAEWKFYPQGSTPATLTIDMGDEGAANTMAAFYVQIPVT